MSKFLQSALFHWSNWIHREEFKTSLTKAELYESLDEGKWLFAQYIEPFLEDLQAQVDPALRMSNNYSDIQSYGIGAPLSQSTLEDYAWSTYVEIVGLKRQMAIDFSIPFDEKCIQVTIRRDGDVVGNRRFSYPKIRTEFGQLRGWVQKEVAEMFKKQKQKMH